MKNIKKITVASILSVAAVAMFAGGNANAATTYKGGQNDDGVLTVTRKVSGATNPVTNIYNYTLTADSGNPAATTGVLPTPNKASFNAVAPVSGVATETMNLDFTGTNFTTIGDYYFTLTETDSTDEANYPKTNATYKVIVSVRYATDANNVPTGDLVATVASQIQNSSDTKQAPEIETGTNRTHIEADQTVKGNSADVNKCFTYSINIPAQGSLATAGDTYTVSSSTTCDGKPTVVTVGGTNKISLKHGDTVTIGLNGSTNEMPIGLEYTIALDDKFDYEAPLFNGVQQSSLSTPTKTTVALTDSDFNDANKTPISIEKNVSPNTGVFITVFPFIILAALAGAGTIYVTNKAKNNAE